jgi:glyoxylase-like metal-dependent hydrolase (beta-lactamase superfamily II)
MAIEVTVLIEIKKDGCEVFPVIVPVQNELKSINFFLIKNEQSLTLLDAGIDTNECWTALLDTLNKNGLELNDITEIILTHHHFDHVGLVNRIIAKHPIPIYASPLSILRLKRDIGFLEMRADFYSNLYQKMGCGDLGIKQVAYLKKAILKNKEQAIQSDIVEIKHNELLHFKILAVPGHSPDHIACWDDKRKWLFSGDLLIEHISSNALVEPDLNGKRIHTLTQQRDSLLKCASLNVDLLFPGHGILIDNPNTLIEKRVDRIEEKAKRLYQLIQSGITTAHALAETYYKKTYYEQFSLVMSEIISHLDYLEDQQRIKKDLCNGIWHYSVNV